MRNLQRGDILLCTEMSRLGRGLPAAVLALKVCMEKGVEVWGAKDGYRLGRDMNSRIFDLAEEFCILTKKR